MTSAQQHFLDTLPFDWSRPEARELRDFLAATFFRERPVVEFAVQAGIPPASVAWSQSMLSVWHDLITTARNQNRLRELLRQVAASGEGVAARLRELTAEVPVTEAPTVGVPEPAWRGFGDRSDLERQIFEEPTLLDVGFLQRGVELAPAVVRLLVTLPGGRHYGTAFRIGDDLLLTNHHVLFDDAGAASGVEAWLHYELDGAGRPREHLVIECPPGTIAGCKAHDWAVIRADSRLPAGVPVVDLVGGGSVAVGDRVYIIQHPNGGMKKIGMHHNVVRYTDEDVVQYWTDTEPGSSGSPVFNERWQLVALHHRWIEAGEAGTREYRNQGRRITRVAEGLTAAGLM